MAEPSEFTTDGGNNKFIGVSSDLNDTNWLIDNNDANDGHGIVVGCSGNHATTHAILVKPLVNGFSFDVSHFYTGMLTSRERTERTSRRLSPNGVTVSLTWRQSIFTTARSSSSTATCGLWRTPTRLLRPGSRARHFRPNNLKLDGTSFDPGSDFQFDVADGRALNVRWSKNGGGAVTSFVPIGKVVTAALGGRGDDRKRHRHWRRSRFDECRGNVGLGTSFQCGVVPLASNYVIETDGANAFLDAPHTLGFGYVELVAANASQMAKFDNLAAKTTLNQQIVENNRSTSGADPGAATDVELWFTALGSYQLPPVASSKGRVLWVSTGYAAGPGAAVTLVRDDVTIALTESPLISTSLSRGRITGSCAMALLVGWCREGPSRNPSLIWSGVAILHGLCRWSRPSKRPSALSASRCRNRNGRSYQKGKHASRQRRLREVRCGDSRPSLDW